MRRRAEPTHFFVVPSTDHVLHEVERVVERHERYRVVKRVADAAEVSEALNP